MARLSLLGAGKLLGGYCWALHEENKTLRTSGGGVRTVVIDPKALPAWGVHGILHQSKVVPCLCESLGVVLTCLPLRGDGSQLQSQVLPEIRLRLI